MKYFRYVGLAVCLAVTAPAARGAAPRFEKLSDHCYLFQPAAGGTNVGAVVTSGGVLLVNPPCPPELSAVLDALKRITVKPVTWTVNTDYSLERDGGSAHLSAQEAIVLASKEQRELSIKSPKADANGKSEGSPRFLFTRQMHLFPDNLEIRITALSAKAHTAGDIVVFVPTEKVLFTGQLFVNGSFPAIDQPEGEGTALGWIDGMRRVVEMVPLLKSAMPPPKPGPSKPPPEEKSLEELVTVIPGSGPRSNLQDFKDILEAAHKLRNEISKAVSAGRSRENFIFLGSIGQYRGHPNFESFADLLYDELAAFKSK